MVLVKDREKLIQHIFFLFHTGNNVVLIEETVTQFVLPVFKVLWLFSKIRVLSSNQCIVCISCEIKRDRCPESLSTIKVQERNPESSQIFFQSSKEYRLNDALARFHVNQVCFPRFFNNKVKALSKMNISLSNLPAYK